MGALFAMNLFMWADMRQRIVRLEKRIFDGHRQP